MKVVTISGNIGSGKTTLFNDLKSKFPDALFIPEYIDGDPEGHSKLISYLNGETSSYEFQNYILDYYESKIPEIKAHTLTIVERSPLEGIMTFAQIDYENDILSEFDYMRLANRARAMKCYNRKSKSASYNITEIQNPDLNAAIAQTVINFYGNDKRLIHINLKIPPETCMKNIKQRNRDGESVYTMDHIRRLDYFYNGYWLYN